VASNVRSDFERFYLTSRDGCYRALLATVTRADEADDLLAEAYARALAKWRTVRRHPAPQAWVVRTALNLHRDQWRRSSRRRAVPRRVDVSAPEPPIDPALLAAVHALPERQREVVALRVLLGLSAADTAEALGIDAGTVGTHLRRALSTLRSQLHPHDAEPALLTEETS
jgi:RNA polymerase sigma factor (sigma-70 family)